MRRFEHSEGASNKFGEVDSQVALAARGEAQDGGSIRDFNKPLGGMMREGEVQTLDPVVVGRVGQWDNIDTSVALGTLPAVVVSELIRDLQSLGA
ncbi:hypothetical protein F2P45_05995 [Massilia sp. CCM 8733]|uniref:Uncharacterized protein n=1 Tax=Massilia mucilaginosa TaxID=2609282 RepID=A0ABX0NP70_9BURK|nr:hypothetical protein [Massilia mucilaginosa]NHZ88576.1 hypothetical protein [Massilia mucilaginosa]